MILFIKEFRQSEDVIFVNRMVLPSLFGGGIFLCMLMRFSDCIPDFHMKIREYGHEFMYVLRMVNLFLFLVYFVLIKHFSYICIIIRSAASAASS